MISGLLSALKSSVNQFINLTRNESANLEFSDDEEDASTIFNPKKKRKLNFGMSSNPYPSLSGTRNEAITYGNLESNSINTITSPEIAAFRFEPALTSTGFKGASTTVSRPIGRRFNSTNDCSPRRRTCDILRKIDKSTSDFSKVVQPKKFGSIFSWKNRFTARDSYRLDELEKYRQLLQSYTTAQIKPIKRKQLALPASPVFLDLSADSDDDVIPVPVVNKATKKSKLGSHATNFHKDRLQKSEKNLFPSISKPTAAPFINNYEKFRSSFSEKKSESKSETSLIDLTTPDRTPSESDDEVKIVGETKRATERGENSLENRLAITYSDDWLRDMKNSLREKENLRKSIIENAEKIRTESRLSKYEDGLVQKISDRISQLDIEYPESVVEVSEVEEFPELTNEIRQIVQRAFRGGPPTQVLADKFSIRITRKDIHTLAGLNWLNDEVINFYMNMLMERGQSEDYPSVHAFNTFFYSKLLKTGYNSVRRWTKKIDIFSYDVLIVPVHLGMHWCLATIDFRDNTIRYYDSMLGNNQNCLEELAKYLSDEHKDKKGTSMNLSKFSKELVKKIPRQMNGSDCGMFSCKFAEYISRDGKINFTQEHMPYFRQRMVYEIVTQKLM